MEKIILIGGSPTAGKSHTARLLSEELKLPWISTDTIRSQMQSLFNKDNAPDLFRHIDPSPDASVKYYASHSLDEMIQGQNAESAEVWKGVKGIIEGDYTWRDFIIEGVAILPGLASNLSVGKEIKTLFLIDEDKERVRNTIFTRGLWDEAEKYPNSVKDQEAEWVFAFNDWIKQEAQKYNMPIFSVDRKDYLAEIKKFIES